MVNLTVTAAADIFRFCHCCLFPYVTCSIWCEAVTFTHQSVLCRAWRMFTQGDEGRTWQHKRIKAASLFVAPSSSKGKKIISNFFRFKGLFFFFNDIILTKNLCPIASQPMEILWLNPSLDSFACLQTYLQSFVKIQLGFLRKYLIKLAFGRDPDVITHRTVCIVTHKRARKRLVTKQGVWFLPPSITF